MLKKAKKKSKKSQKRGEDVMKGMVSLVKSSKGLVKTKALHRDNFDGVSEDNVALSKLDRKSYHVRRF